MSTVNDLEVLEVLEQIKRNQKSKKGDPGPAGVGIEKIEQFTDDSFTIRLTTGEFKKISLPSAKDGEVGPQGVPGNSVTGPAGSRGPAGADAAPARDGKDGQPGVSLRTAVVNAEGQLLLALTDGSTIVAGRVVGPVGSSGARGATGLPGSPGRDGTAVLSGPRTPTQDDGEEGDHWIDISSAEFNFYKKSGNGWSMLASLRQPGKNPAVAIPVGGGGSGSSGPAAGYNTSNLPMTGKGSGRFGKADDGLQNPTPPGGVNKPGGKIIPPANALRFQSDCNEWVVDSLDALDDNLPVHKVESLPAAGAYMGDMVLFDDALWIWHGAWIEVGGALDPCDFTRSAVGENPPETPEPCLGDLWFCTEPNDLSQYIFDGENWIPASPPVSLDGIEGDVKDLQNYVDVHVTPALAGATGDIRALEADVGRHGDKLSDLEDGVTGNARDITQLRGRVGDSEAKNVEQDGRLDALETAEDSGPGDGNFAELDGLNTFTRQNTFEARTVMNNHLTLQSDDDSHRLYVKNKTGDTNLTLFPNGSISTKSHINFTPTGAASFAERYSSYIRVDSPPNWSSNDGDFGLYIDISRANSQQNRFVVGGRAGREKAFEVYDDGTGKARVHGNLTVNDKTTTNTLEVTDEAAIKNAQFTGSCDVSNASHTSNCALPKSYFTTVLKEYNGQFRSIYINHGSDGTGNGVPIQIKAAPTAGNLIELRDSTNATRFGINVGSSLMYGGTTSAPWMATKTNHFTTKKYVDEAIEAEKKSDSIAGPSGMRFKYGGTNINTIAPGEFILSNNNVYISTENADGVKWGGGAIYRTDAAKIWSHCTIYKVLGNGGFDIDRMYQVEEFRIGEAKGTTRMLELCKVWQKFGEGLPATNADYIISLGGFF